MGKLGWIKVASGCAAAFCYGLAGKDSNLIPKKQLQSAPTDLQRDKQRGNALLEKLKSELLDIESRSDLTPDEKVRQVTHISCATCAGIAIQPIPFADIIILTPVQIYMGSRIAAIRGVPVSESEAEEILKEIVGALGLGFLAQYAAITIWKFLTAGFGGVMTIPIVYGLTFAIMRVMDQYFIAKAENKRLTPSEIKSLWQRARAEGEKKGEAIEISLPAVLPEMSVNESSGRQTMSLQELVKQLDAIPQSRELKSTVEALLQQDFKFPSHVELRGYAFGAYGSHAKWPHAIAYCYVLLAKRAEGEPL